MTSLENYSTEPESVDEMLQKLEHAIKNSYLPEFEEFVKENVRVQFNCFLFIFLNNH